jgi:hypothetical protein
MIGSRSINFGIMVGNRRDILLESRMARFEGESAKVSSCCSSGTV